MEFELMDWAGTANGPGGKRMGRPNWLTVLWTQPKSTKGKKSKFKINRSRGNATGLAQIGLQTGSKIKKIGRGRGGT